MRGRHAALALMLVCCLAMAMMSPRGLQATPAPVHAGGTSGGAARTGASQADWETAAKIVGALVALFTLVAMVYKLSYLALGSLLMAHKITRGHVLDAVLLELALDEKKRDKLRRLLSDQSVSARIPEGGFDPAMLAALQEMLRRPFAPAPPGANGPGHQTPSKKTQSVRASKRASKPSKKTQSVRASKRASKPSTRTSRAVAEPVSRPPEDGPARSSRGNPEDT